ncbi:hypothetical protein FI667_g5990, partial [Globisporangium splendens]
MAEHPLQACMGNGDTVVASSAILKEESVTVEDRADDDTDSEHDDVHPKHADNYNRDGSQRQTPRRSSYRILGAHNPQRLQQQEDDDHGEDEDDPMAWADLEAFGGTKKTLEKKKPVRKMTPEEVREQLQELDEIEHRMLEAHREKKSKKGMIDTIAWLKKHNEHVDASRDVNHKMKRSSSFVRSLLSVFSLGSRSRNNSRHEDPPRSNNSYSEHSNSVFDEEYEHFPKLAAPWGQKESNCTWSEVGFGILNEAILEDMRRVRAVVSSGALASATPQALVAVAKWLTLFDQHVHDVITLKEYLLEERTVIAGVGYKVTTVYDTYSETLATALEKVHDDRRYLGDAIIATFNELEAVLREEVLAVQDVISQSLTEEQEYEALSNLFHHLSEEEGCGVIIAKLLGWMKTNFDVQDTKAFLDLFDHDAQDKIAGEWMRQYASYLHLLDEFSANSETPMTFYT